MEPNRTPDQTEQEHSCPCCNNSEMVDKLISMEITPPILCDRVVQIAKSRGKYHLVPLKKESDRLNRIEERKRLAGEKRGQMGRTSSME